MVDVVQTPQQRIITVLEDAKKLRGTTDKTNALRMAELLAEAETLEKQIDAERGLDALNDRLTRSAGMLPLATPGADAKATVITGKPAGETVLDAYQRRDGTPAFRVAQEYGEGIYAPSIIGKIGTRDYKDAFRAYVRSAGQVGRHGYNDAAIRTLQEGQDAEGGYLVPDDILSKVIVKEPTPIRVAGRCTQLTTSRDNLVVPRVNYTADDIYTTGMRITWTGEIPASSTAMRVTDPVFGQTRIPVFTAMMSVPITLDMIEDASFPLLDWISGKFGETVDLLRDNMVLNGTGVGQPEGILASPGADSSQPAVVLSGTAGSIGTDGTFLIKLAMSLPEQYDTNAVWVMNKTNTGNAVAQLKDAQGRFLWSLGYQQSGLSVDFKSQPLVGYPVMYSGFMPNIAAANYPLLFGDLAGYYLVNRIGFSVQVLRELYAETNQVLVLGRIRFGGQVAEPWRLKLGKSNNS